MMNEFETTGLTKVADVSIIKFTLQGKSQEAMK
jgi:hypothetical protein